MYVNSAIQHSDDMTCEVTEGWTTGALMYLIFTITYLLHGAESSLRN